MPEQNERKGGREVPARRGAVPAGEFALADLGKLRAKLENEVTVIYGMHERRSDDLVGRTVAAVQDAVKHEFQIPPETIPLVNGEPVGGGYVLKARDALEFIRTSGVCPKRNLPS